MEMLTCIKNCELEKKRLQHVVDNQELEDSFENLYLDEVASGDASASTSGAGTSACASVASTGT